VKPMQAALPPGATNDGKMIEEGTIFRLGENDFILTPRCTSSTGCMKALRLRRRHRGNLRALLRLGAARPDLARDPAGAGVGGIDNLPHFGYHGTTIEKRWMRIDRAGFTGDLGYELWVKAGRCALAWTACHHRRFLQESRQWAARRSTWCGSRPLHPGGAD